MNVYTLLLTHAAISILAQASPRTIFELGYMGPQTVMPIASFIAALIGIILVTWRFLIKLVRKVFSLLFHRTSDADALSATDDKS